MDYIILDDINGTSVIVNIAHIVAVTAERGVTILDTVSVRLGVKNSTEEVLRKIKAYKEIEKARKEIDTLRERFWSMPPQLQQGHTGQGIVESITESKKKIEELEKEIQ